MSNTESNLSNLTSTATTAGAASSRTSPSRGRHRIFNSQVNPKFSGKSVLEAKRLSQLALQRHAISQLKKIGPPSTPPNRGTIAYTLGKDLFLVLRYIPLGLLNKVQSSISSQFNLTTTSNTAAAAAANIINPNARYSSTRSSSSSSKGSQDKNSSDSNKDPSQSPEAGIGSVTNNNGGKVGDGNEASKVTSVIEPPTSITPHPNPNQLQCQGQNQNQVEGQAGQSSATETSVTASIFNRASLITLMMKEKVYMLKNNINYYNLNNTNLFNNPADPISSKLSRFASGVSTKLSNRTEARVEDSKNESLPSSSSSLSVKVETNTSVEKASDSTSKANSVVLSPSDTDWGIDPDLKPFMQENIHSEWKFVEARTRFLVSKIISVADDTRASKIQHVEDLYRHLSMYRESRGTAIESGAVKSLVKIIKSHPDDTCLVNCTRETLGILGCNPPLKGHGIKVLSIDGGGVRGLVAIEVLRLIEKQTGKRIHELFDYICGVSTGSILAFLIGSHRRTLDECEALYMQLSQEIFNQNSFIGASSLLWSHSYYDTAAWERILKRHIGLASLMSQARDPDLPRVAAISTLVNHERVSPYVFRTYAFAPHIRSHYTGGSRHEMWEAVRASAAAPSYFEEVKLGSNLHQDGGVLVNNPSSVALSEARTIWQGQPLQCVMSLGTGQTFSSRKNPNMSDLSAVAHSSSDGHRHKHRSPSASSSKKEHDQASCSSLSWKGKFLKVLDSATDTESVHYTLQELLPTNVYFRFNPYLNEMITMDEVKPERLAQLQKETREFLARNMDKVEFCCENLTREKGMTKKLYDWWNFQGSP